MTKPQGIRRKPSGDIGIPPMGLHNGTMTMEQYKREREVSDRVHVVRWQTSGLGED